MVDPTPPPLHLSIFSILLTNEMLLDQADPVDKSSAGAGATVLDIFFISCCLCRPSVVLSSKNVWNWNNSYDNDYEEKCRVEEITGVQVEKEFVCLFSSY